MSLASCVLARRSDNNEATGRLGHFRRDLDTLLINHTTDTKVTTPPKQKKDKLEQKQGKALFGKKQHQGTRLPLALLQWER